jgi:hypothetical protein
VKSPWITKPCGCVKATLPRAGKVAIRCTKHRGNKSKRLLCYWDENGQVRSEHPLPAREPVQKEPVRQRRLLPGPDVYFARLGDLIKIGISKDPEARAYSLNAELMGTLPGGRTLEKELHKEFVALRERGEWFRVDDALLARIEELLR